MHCNLIIVSLFPEAINSFISISCLPVAILLYHYCCAFKMQFSIFVSSLTAEMVAVYCFPIEYVLPHRIL